MQRIPRDLARKFAFDWRDQPLLRVRPGETFEVMSLSFLSVMGNALRLRGVRL